MLEIAKEKLKIEIQNKSIILLEHDFSNNSIIQKYDICLITWYTFNYISKNAVKFLKNISKNLNNDSMIVMDLFYPNTLKKPEINNKWVEKEIYLENKKYLIKDKRNIKNNVEERIQIFEIGGRSTKISTNRFYYSKADIKNILIKAGYSEIKFIENYDVSTIHTLGKNENTENDYICIAKNALSIA